MINKALMMRFLQLALGGALVFWLLPMQNAHLNSMMTSKISKSDVFTITASRLNHSPSTPCCGDVLSQSSVTCSFMILRDGYVVPQGGSQRVVYSPLVIRSIDLQLVSPPPKI